MTMQLTKAEVLDIVKANYSIPPTFRPIDTKIKLSNGKELYLFSHCVTRSLEADTIDTATLTACVYVDTKLIGYASVLWIRADGFFRLENIIKGEDK